MKKLSKLEKLILVTTVGVVGAISIAGYSILTKKNKVDIANYYPNKIEKTVNEDDLGRTLRKEFKYKTPVYFDTKSEPFGDAETKNKTLEDIINNKETLLRDYNLVEISREIFDRMDSFGKGLNSGINYAIIPLMLHDTSFDNIPNSQIEELRKHYKVTIIKDNENQNKNKYKINKTGKKIVDSRGNINYTDYNKNIANEINNKSTNEIITVKDRKTNKTIYYISKAEEFMSPSFYDGKGAPPKTEFLLYSIGFKGDIDIKKEEENQIKYLIDIAEQVKIKGGFTVIGYPFTDMYHQWKEIDKKTREDLYTLIKRTKEQNLPVIIQVFDPGLLLWMKQSNKKSEELVENNSYIIPVAGSSAHTGYSSLYAGIAFDGSDISTSDYTSFIKSIEHKIESRDYLVIKQYMPLSTWIKADIFPMMKSLWGKAKPKLGETLKKMHLW